MPTGKLTDSWTTSKLYTPTSELKVAVQLKLMPSKEQNDGRFKIVFCKRPQMPVDSPELKVAGGAGKVSV